MIEHAFRSKRPNQSGFTVALLGPDGAGKSTVSRGLPALLGGRARYVYMGINLEASNLLLPSTRLLLLAKRARGGRPDLAPVAQTVTRTEPEPRSPASRLKTLLRVGNLIAEEWFRQAVITRHRQRGEIVILDRHFFFDYYDSDVAPLGPIPVIRRFHGVLLREVYPRPDLVIVLDAPGAVLHARKGEGSIVDLERRRKRYRAMLGEVQHGALVDATQPVDQVLEEVASLIETYGQQRTGRPPRDEGRENLRRCTQGGRFRTGVPRLMGTRGRAI